MSIVVRKSQCTMKENRSRDDDNRLCLVDDLKEVLNHIHVKFKKEFTISLDKDENKAGTSDVGHEDDDGVDGCKGNGGNVDDDTNMVDTTDMHVAKEENEELNTSELTETKKKVIPELSNEEKDEAKEYETFEKIIKNQMNTTESKKNIKDVNFTFFPTVAEGQYYVIVSNLLKANSIILYNESNNNYNKYKDVFDSVNALFLKYLHKHDHPCVEKLTKENPAKVLKLKWKTKKNKIDSG
ncbi:hypothetical protein Tco_0721031 [Tanacetum coccineum]